MTVEINSKELQERVEKLEKRERGTVAEAGTRIGTEKYELQSIGGQKIQIRRMKLQERKKAIMNAASCKIGRFPVTSLDWRLALQGTKNTHEPNAFCNRERRKQLALDFLKKYLEYNEPVKIIM